MDNAPYDCTYVSVNNRKMGWNRIGTLQTEIANAGLQRFQVFNTEENFMARRE
jgi:hypothetical protein